MKHKLLHTLIFFIAIAAGLKAQPNQKSMAEIRLADEYYKQYAYRIAINHYRKAYEEDTVTHYIKLQLARCYYAMRNFHKAEEWATRTIEGGYKMTEENMYYYIEILASNQHFYEAAYWIAQYKRLANANETRIKRLESFLMMTDFEGLGKNYYTFPINVNTSSTEFAPAYYKNGIVFLSNRKAGIKVKKFLKSDGVDYLNLFYTTIIDKEQYSEPELFSKDVQSKYHEGPVCFYKNNSKMIFTRSNINKQMIGTKANQSKDGSTSLALYFADVKNDTVSNIKPFKYNNTDYNCANPTISEDGTKLIFSSDRPDSYGKSDLYICYWHNNDWTYPKNMGNVINTSGAELFPYLSGNILYFSSDGHPGMGGLDNYFTILINDEAGEIINPGYQINSSADDFSLISKDGQRAYFASNRGNKNNDNIYYAEYVEPPVLKAHIRALDSSTMVVLDSIDVEVIDTTLNETLIAYQKTGDSIFSYKLKKEKTYKAIVSSHGYFNKEAFFFSGNSTGDNLKWDVPMSPIKANVPIRLNNIYFDFDKASLRDTSKIELNRLIKWMEDNPDVAVAIHTHTDSWGDENYNLWLSDQRAKSIVEYIVSSGIDSTRLSSQGFGESQPIVDCPVPEDCSSEDHQLNRRSEFVIIDTSATKEESIEKTNDETMAPNMEN